jgi:hypothetical protein
MKHPTGKTPKRVTLIAAGPSKAEWTDIMAATGIEGPSVDEVWGINGVGRSIKVDVTFMMDDYYVQRAHLPTKAEWFETAGHPIITSTPRKESPTSHAYPLGEVLALPGARDYLNHTVAYAIAYAIVLGVKELLIFGADYVASGAHYDNSGKHNNRPIAGRYMGCTSFWLGVASARGMDVVVCPKSPLLDADVPTLERFYGYVYKPVIRRTIEQPQPKRAAQ